MLTIWRIRGGYRVHNEIEQLFCRCFKPKRIVKINQTAYPVAIQRHNSDIRNGRGPCLEIAFALKSYGHYDHSGQNRSANGIESPETVLTLIKTTQQAFQIVKQNGEPSQFYAIPTNFTKSGPNYSSRHPGYWTVREP
jgi:hypothetical protein